MKNWYSECRKEIEKLYGDDADLFCDLLAATSPRKQVTANWGLAVRTYEGHKAGNIDYTGCLPAHIPNIKRAIAGEELSGRKVKNFAANLRGDLDKITVDIWIMRYFGLDKLTDKLYTMIEQSIRASAILEGVKPAELQATLWYEALIEAGRTPKSFLCAIDRQMKLF